MKDRFSRSLRLVASVVLFSSAALAQRDTQIKGSDTLIYLGQRVASFYQRTSAEMAIHVSGGGAPNTLALNQIAQWEGNTAAPLKNDAVVFPVGIQAIVIYVNRSNPVRELTLSQVRKVFGGEITNWKELGGRNSAIQLYAGESSTGTLDYFESAVLEGKEPYPFVGKANTADLLNEIAQHPDAIGYGSLGSNSEVRAVSLKLGAASLAVEPSSDNIRARKYPITRNVYWAISRGAPGPSRALCQWMLSSEGQLVVESVGFQPLLPADRAANMAKLGSVVPARVLPVTLHR